MLALGTLLLFRLPVCICFLGAIYLLATGVTVGWGWLIFAGLLCTGGSYSFKTKDDEKENKV